MQFFLTESILKLAQPFIFSFCLLPLLCFSLFYGYRISNLKQQTKDVQEICQQAQYAAQIATQEQKIWHSLKQANLLARENESQFFAHNNHKLVFIEKKQRRSKDLIETELQLKKAVDLSNDDLKLLLASAEGNEHSQHPQIIVKMMTLSRDKSSAGSEIYRTDLEIIKRELAP